LSSPDFIFELLFRAASPGSLWRTRGAADNAGAAGSTVDYIEKRRQRSPEPLSNVDFFYTIGSVRNFDTSFDRSPQKASVYPAGTLEVHALALHRLNRVATYHDRGVVLAMRVTSGDVVGDLHCDSDILAA
jgi:hypothetical protein